MTATPLPLETQTLYVEALERARVMDLDRSFGQLSGSFATKQVGGAAFWYFRTSEGGQGRREVYLGPDGPAARAAIQRHAAERVERASGQEGLDRLAAMLAQGGCTTVDGPSARVIAALAAGGVFRLGGVLVGTHAFLALGNLLGVRWAVGTRTQDLDSAAFRTLDVAAPQAPTDLWKSLEALDMGFLPTPGLNPRSPSTSYFIRGRELRVDLLTTGSHRGSSAPVFLPRFNAAAQPLRFLDYLLTGAVDALALGRASATLVRVPSPARIGFHKLLVAEARGAAFAAKAAKDVAQAAAVLGHLLQAHPAEVALACEDLEARRLAARVRRTVQRQLPGEAGLLAFLRR